MKCCYVLVLDFVEEVPVPARGMMGRFHKPKVVAVVDQELHHIHEDSADDEMAANLARTWKERRENHRGSVAIKSVLYQEVCSI
jgi:hypothetical protein